MMGIGDWNIKRKLKSEMKTYGGAFPNIPEKCWDEIIKDIKYIATTRLKSSNNTYDYFIDSSIKEITKVFAVMFQFYKPDNIYKYKLPIEILSKTLDKYNVSYRKIEFTKD